MTTASDYDHSAPFRHLEQLTPCAPSPACSAPPWPPVSSVKGGTSSLEPFATVLEPYTCWTSATARSHSFSRPASPAEPEPNVTEKRASRSSLQLISRRATRVNKYNRTSTSFRSSTDYNSPLPLGRRRSIRLPLRLPLDLHRNGNLLQLQRTLSPTARLFRRESTYGSKARSRSG